MARSSHQRCFVKKGVFKACNFIKKKLQHRYFPVTFAKILRTPILKNICQRLLLYGNSYSNNITNIVILNATTNFLIAAERFDVRLF